jgi:hypothetical protein
MSQTPRPPRQTPPKPADRKARLAAALKANIAKRKDQARGKAGSGETPPGPTETKKG